MKNGRFQNFFFLLQYAKPYKIDFAIGLFFVGLSTGAILWMGSLIQAFIRELQQGNTQGFQNTTIQAFALIFIASTAVLGRIYFFGTLGEKMIKDVKDSIFAHLMKMDISFFESRKIGDLLSLILSDAYVVHAVFICNASGALRNIVMLLGGIVMMGYFSLWLLSGVLVLGGILTFSSHFLSQKIHFFSREGRKNSVLMSAHAEETLSAIRLIHAYNFQDTSFKNFCTKTDAEHGAIKKRVLFFGFNNFITGSVLFSGILLLLFLSHHSSFCALTSVDLGGFAYYAIVAVYALSDLLETMGQVYGSLASSERLRELMSHTSKLQASLPWKDRLIQKNEGISFSHISFAYPSVPDS